MTSLSGSDISDEIFVADIEPSITPTLTIFENLEFQGVGACNDFLGLYGFASDQILIVDQFDNTQAICASDDQNDFEVSYFQNLVQEQTDLLYTISFGDQDDEFGLLIENVLGGFLRFSNEPLRLDKAKIVSVKMHPNPAQDTLYFETNGQLIFRVEIMDAMGKIVIEKENEFSQIDISLLLSGVYFVRITSGNRTAIKKLIKS